MNKITVIIPQKLTAVLKRVLKESNLTNYVVITGKKTNKVDIYVTNLKTQEAVNSLKNALLGPGKPRRDVKIMVMENVNMIAPYIEEKEKPIGLEEVIKKDVKRFVKIDQGFLLFTVCSTMIACFGFLLDNLVVLIGSMLIFPLMSSIMSVSYGIIKQDNGLIKKGAKTELIGVLIIILVSTTMGLIVPNNDLSMETEFAVSNPLQTLVLTMVIGLVGGYSFLSSKMEALTGVAVSISIMPPLTNAVLLSITGNFILSITSISLFAINILGMHASSALIFSLMYKKHGVNNKKEVKK